MVTLDWSAWPLRWKFLAGFSLVVLVSVVGMVEVFGRVIEDALHRQILVEFRDLARTQRAALEKDLWHQLEVLSMGAEEETLISTAMDRSLTHADPVQRAYVIQQEALLWSLGSDSALRRRILQSPAAEKLRDLRGRLQGHLHLMLTDADGALTAATEPPRAFRFDQEPWWKAAWNQGRGALYISDLTFDEDLQTSVVYLAVPVYRRDTRQAIGVLRSAYGASQIFGILSQFRSGRTGRALLLDRDGVVLMDPLGLLHRSQRITALPVIPSEDPEGVASTPDFLVAYSRVG
ncbi:MAG: hypothetical protein C4314_01810, partial [Thermoflexus sp.]